MQKTWTEDQQTIRSELEGLIVAQTELTLFQQGQTPRKLRPMAIESGNDGDWLSLKKLATFQTPSGNSLILYHSPSSAMRGFPVTPVLETTTELGITLPNRIIQIQRRRHPRLTVGPDSTATFTKLGSQAIYNGQIKDISIEGAKLTGTFTQTLRKEDRLTPLTLVLRLRFGDYEEAILIPEAVVRHRKDVEKEIMELGVHFRLTKNDLYRLDTYLTLRTLELEALAQARGAKN